MLPRRMRMARLLRQRPALTRRRLMPRLLQRLKLAKKLPKKYQPIGSRTKRKQSDQHPITQLSTAIESVSKPQLSLTCPKISFLVGFKN